MMMMMEVRPSRPFALLRVFATLVFVTVVLIPLVNAEDDDLQLRLVQGTISLFLSLCLSLSLFVCVLLLSLCF